MEYIESDRILEFNANTLEDVRKAVGFNNPEDLNGAIDNIEEWLKKHNYLLKKNFSRRYLELRLLQKKGSIESAKKSIEQLCYYRTVLPAYFGDTNPAKEFEKYTAVVNFALLPKLTEDNVRVGILKLLPYKYPLNLMSELLRLFITVFEYSYAHDYCSGHFVVVDYRDVVNLLDLVPLLSPTILMNVMNVLQKGYSGRIKGICILSESKFIDIVISAIKNGIINDKIKDRFHHGSLESLHGCITKDILPVEYGGKERPLATLHDEWLKLLSSDAEMEYRREMSEARVDQSRRPRDQLDDDLMGTSGSFRSLSVD